MFHRDTESVTFHVAGEQRTKQQHHTKRDCDYNKNRNRSDKDQ